MAGKLTTHVIDTAAGQPAAGLCVALHRLAANGREILLGRWTTNADGRCDEPLLEGEAFAAGCYRLRFAAGDYFRAREATVALAEPRFVDIVELRFGVADHEGHYHVPLLVSPWSYSTYRGS